VNRIVYLHGFASSPASGKAQYFSQRLTSAGYHVSIPNLDEGDFKGLTISGQLRVVEREAAGGATAVIGSSMGGYLAALYAARHPEIERVVLLAPAFGFARRWPLRLGDETVAAWREMGTMEVFHYAEGRDRPVGYQLLEDGARYEDHPDVRQPCLIFHGVRDEVVPVSFSQEFAAGRANVELHTVESGHELTDVLDLMWTRVEPFLHGR
jgi:pimeloyl-ACP methyl ester carboxylesterase